MPKLPQILEKIGGSEKALKKEFFWALLAWDDGIKTAIWTVEEGKTKVVVLGSWQDWDGESVEGLTRAVDKSFTFCTQQIEGQAKEPEKVIFGLPEAWTEGGGIKKDRQALLGKVCKKLDLAPVGWVSTFDAIAFHLKKIEGIPLSAILVRPGRRKILVAVCEVGKTVKVEEVARSSDVAADTCEGLLRFEVETLPSRILVFDSEDMEEARQKLTAFHWEAERAGEKKLPFLHFPKIEVLPADFDINAVSLAGGTEVAKSLGFTITEEEKKKIQKALPEEAESEVAPPAEEVLPEKDLGFVKGKDILKKIPEEKVEVLEKPEPAPEAPETKEPEVVEVEKAVKEEEKPTPKPSFSLRLSFSDFKQKLSGISLPSLPGGNFIILALLVFILLSAGAFLWFLWYYPKASITIFVAPKTLEEEILITVDPTQEILDEEEGILPAILVESQESGERQKETTGQKTVGEKATGEVVIYNRTSSAKTFDKGTVLVGPGDLEFSLDREASVASKSPDLQSGVDKWGEAKVEVTASEIGAQFNLASDSQFEVQDFPSSSFLAKNVSAFTGGTSRQIQAVSEEDREVLLEDLSFELEEGGKGGLLARVTEGQKLIEESISSEVSQEDFSHEVGDEAKTLSCKVKVKIFALAYKEDDFIRLVREALSEKIPENYELKKEEVEASFEEEEKKEDGSFVFKVFAKVGLLPKVETDEIFAKIKGKRPGVARKYLEDLPGFIEAEILMRPGRLPSFLQFLPRLPEKIEIEVRGR